MYLISLEQVFCLALAEWLNVGLFFGVCRDPFGCAPRARREQEPNL